MQPTDDYRAIHLDRGQHYDASLATVPFDAYMADWERHHLQQLVPGLFPSRVGRYLDFACGTGRATETVAAFCKESVGVDISPTMLAVAAEKVPGTRFELRDLTRDDPDMGRFDLITSFRFFGNAQDDLRESAMAALVKRLAPGGYLIINSHRNPRALYAVFDRLTGGDGGGMDLHFSKLGALLQRHGLRTRVVKPIGAWMVRSRMLNAYRADDAVAVAREGRFSHPALAHIAPDTIVVAQRA